MPSTLIRKLFDLQTRAVVQVPASQRAVLSSIIPLALPNTVSPEALDDYPFVRLDELGVGIEVYTYDPHNAGACARFVTLDTVEASLKAEERPQTITVRRLFCRETGSYYSLPVAARVYPVSAVPDPTQKRYRLRELGEAPSVSLGEVGTGVPVFCSLIPQSSDALVPCVALDVTDRPVEEEEPPPTLARFPESGFVLTIYPESEGIDWVTVKCEAWVAKLSPKYPGIEVRRQGLSIVFRGNGVPGFDLLDSARFNGGPMVRPAELSYNDGPPIPIRLS